MNRTFRQLQQIRTYYEFSNIDVDRYRVGHEYRQVMLSARELSRDLPDKAETWVNRHLQNTHGYGLAMRLTAKKSEKGAPVLIVKDLPPRTEGGLIISHPAIYYGETSAEYRIGVDDARFLSSIGISAGRHRSAPARLPRPQSEPDNDSRS